MRFIKMTQKKSPDTSKGKGMGKNKKLLIRIGAIVLAVAIVFVLQKLKDKPETEEEYMFTKEGELSFADSLGNTKIKIDMEVADTDYDRQLGLMNRKQMDEKQCMLFIFPDEKFQSFWMRNTFISLDMIFVGADYRIVTIHKNTQTLSDQSYPSSKPSKYVIEVVGGFTDKYKINVGDKVNWMGTRL